MEFINATIKDKDSILKLYKSLLNEEFCPWNDNYPTEQEIDFDLSRDSLFVLKEKGQIIASISIDDDEETHSLNCWSKDLFPSGELSRLAVDKNYQNQGIARLMILNAMKVLKERNYRGVYFLVNKHNVKALNSYNHLEFNEVGECHLFEQDFVCFEKEL